MNDDEINLGINLQQKIGKILIIDPHGCQALSNNSKIRQVFTLPWTLNGSSCHHIIMNHNLYQKIMIMKNINTNHISRSSFFLEANIVEISVGQEALSAPLQTSYPL